MSYGVMRIGDTFLPITELGLTEGAIEITASAPGPLSADEGMIRIFSPLGYPVTDHLPETKYVKLPMALLGDTVTAT